MHRSLTICVQYSISSKMGVVHFRPQHFFLGPSRVDKLDLHLQLILYVHALSVVCTYFYRDNSWSTDAVLFCTPVGCLINSFSRTIHVNITFHLALLHSSATQAEPYTFKRWRIRPETGDKITVRDILESRTEFGQNYLVLTWKDTKRNMYPYFCDFE